MPSTFFAECVVVGGGGCWRAHDPRVLSLVYVERGVWESLCGLLGGKVRLGFEGWLCWGEKGEVWAERDGAGAGDLGVGDGMRLE